MRIGTHNGVFHADDVFACAVMNVLENGPHDLVRTRDEAVLATCDVVVDVGGKYDSPNGRFDHHQKGGAGARENGVPYSSFGLVWKHFGHDCCGDMKVVKRVDEMLVQSVDAADCGFALQGKPNVEGVRSMSVSAMVSLLNPTWEEVPDFDRAFTKAVETAEMILRRAIQSARASEHAATGVAKAISASEGAVVVLDKFLPWQETVFPEQYLYVTFPSEAGTWMVQAIPPTPGSFDKRKPLPASWGGLRDNELAELTGVEDAVFCHIGLFICGAKTREGALALARLAVEA
jgi:uncharacterized UPF0160 family protein